MEKEDILLGVEMGKLEIEPIKFNISRIDINPFKSDFKNNALPECHIVQKETKCACKMQKRHNISGVVKKKPNKILKEPVLRLLKTNTVEDVEECLNSLNNNLPKKETFDPLNLCTLVRNCNQLKISTRTSEQRCQAATTSDNKWWKQDIQYTHENKETRQYSSQPSCSQQALNPPCDVTIDELASYFETLVHIPKKMSSMAEMMYI